MSDKPISKLDQLRILRERGLSKTQAPKVETPKPAETPAILDDAQARALAAYEKRRMYMREYMRARRALERAEKQRQGMNQGPYIP